MSKLRQEKEEETIAHHVSEAMETRVVWRLVAPTLAMELPDTSSHATANGSSSAEPQPPMGTDESSMMTMTEAKDL